MADHAAPGFTDAAKKQWQAIVHRLPLRILEKPERLQ